MLVVALIALIALAIVLTSCGGGDEESAKTSSGQNDPVSAGSSASDGPSATSNDSGNVTSTSPDPTANGTQNAVPGDSAGPGTSDEDPPLFAGYDLKLSEGDFWRFRWEYLDRSCAQGAGCKTTEDDGVFQVTLGTPIEWMGSTVFPAGYSGKSGYNDDGTTRSFELKWKFIGVKGDRIVATNGTGDSPLVTLFDARTGKWPGSGFFAARFPDDVLIEASAGQLTDSDEFASWDGVQTGP